MNRRADETGPGVREHNLDNGADCWCEPRIQIVHRRGGIAIAMKKGVRMSKLCIDELTIGQLKELVQFVGVDLKSEVAAHEHPYQVGKNYFIRTVTHYYTGLLVRVTTQELVLQDAAWIADTGRFANALEEGELNEVEPFPVGDVIIGRGAVVDAVLWGKALPRKTK